MPAPNNPRRITTVTTETVTTAITAELPAPLTCNLIGKTLLIEQIKGSRIGHLYIVEATEYSPNTAFGEAFTDARHVSLGKVGGLMDGQARTVESGTSGLFEFSQYRLVAVLKD